MLDRKEIPESFIESTLKPLVSTRISRSQIDEKLAILNKWLSDNGYVASRIVVIHYPGLIDRSLTLLCLEPILSGIRVMIVDQHGLPIPNATARTDLKVLQRVLGIKVGKVFHWTPDGFGALMAMGILEHADAELSSPKKGQVELILKIRERKNCRIEPGVGMTSEGRVYGDVSVVDNNWRGKMQRLVFEWQKHVDMASFSGRFAFEDMRFGAKIPVSIKARAYRNSSASRERAPSGSMRRGDASGTTRRGQDARSQVQGALARSERYEMDRDGALVELGYRPGMNKLLLTLSPMIENVRPTPGLGERIVQAVLQMGAMHVTRLPVDTPRSGHLVAFEYSMGKQLLREGDGGFKKAMIKLSKYFGVRKHSSLAMGLTVGIGSDDLPWHEQKSLGGVSNVRGYRYGELGRYKTYSVGRMELRVPLTKIGSNNEEKKSKPDDDGKSTDETIAERGGLKEEKDEDNGNEMESKNGNLFSPKMFDTLPALVGVLFGDVASNESSRGMMMESVGASYGLGLRVGGVVSVDWTRTFDGKQARLHFGLIDRSL